MTFFLLSIAEASPKSEEEIVQLALYFLFHQAPSVTA
ncbi:MAG: hypothetical protein ACJAY7_000221 [Pseudohongiellaceae bacterium]|jgi:hypothetical protein|tara:strand:- start:674 stop:784 length:111 start_codon:yes stop_codon:yes gene_type:complete